MHGPCFAGILDDGWDAAVVQQVAAKFPELQPQVGTTLGVGRTLLPTHAILIQAPSHGWSCTPFPHHHTHYHNTHLHKCCSLLATRQAASEQRPHKLSYKLVGGRQLADKVLPPLEAELQVWCGVGASHCGAGQGSVMQGKSLWWKPRHCDAGQATVALRQQWR